MRKDPSGKLAFGVVATTLFFLLPLLYVVVFQTSSYLNFLFGRFQRSEENGGLSNEETILNLQRLVRGKERDELDEHGFTCSSDTISKVCLSRNRITFDTRMYTIHIAASGNEHLSHLRNSIQPYARQYDKSALSMVTKINITGTPISDHPHCDVQHSVPAVVFSIGGFSGNLFHTFSDILIPLYLTTRHFQSNVQFVTVDPRTTWVRKFDRFLTHLSNFNVIDAPTDRRVHCFPAAVIGLKYHEDLSCNASKVPTGYTILDFKSFAREAFSLKVRTVEQGRQEEEEEEKEEGGERGKPILVLLSRHTSRRFLNEEEIIEAAKDIGFKVKVASPHIVSNVKKFAQVVNSASVVVGAHGAGITNMVFMPAGAVLIQMVPLGLEWHAKTYFSEPSKNMDIRYLEYKMMPEESTLYEKYPPDDPVISDPWSINMKGYNVSRPLYIEGQDLRVNIERFRQTLLEAMNMLRLQA